MRPGINNNPVGSLSWALTLHISLLLVGPSGLTFSSSWHAGVLYILLCHVQGQAAGVQRITVLPVVRMIFFPGSLSGLRAPTASMVIARGPLLYSVSLNYSLWVLFSVRIGATPGFGGAELQTHCWSVVLTLPAFFPVCLLLLLSGASHGSSMYSFQRFKLCSVEAREWVCYYILSGTRLSSPFWSLY